MGWLEDHLNDFVKPVVGNDYMPWSNDEKIYFKQEELTVIKNSWRSVKRAAKKSGKETILLAGRDVFIYEILARRENYPTKFMPEISRATVNHITIENLEDYFLFDTGFVGSIPKNLGTENFSLLSYAMNRFLSPSALNRISVQNPETKQVFPRLSFSRGLALKIEKTPKYWESARPAGPMHEVEVIQPLSKREEFIAAARLTIEIYTNSSPKFIPTPQPIGKEDIWSMF
jgi:hypothetical protein